MLLEGWPCAQDPAVERVIREPTQGSQGPQTPQPERASREVHAVGCENMIEEEIDSGDRVRKDLNKEVIFHLTSQLYLTT